MKVTTTLRDVFVPKFNDNRELDAGEQITVEIKHPNLSQAGILKQISMDRNERFSFGYNTEKILRQFVGKITNLESEVNGKTIVIGDGKALADDNNPDLEPLVTEICMAVTGSDQLTEGEAKN